MFINMRIKSPLQSWGDQSNSITSGNYRHTYEFPSYAGIIGLLCCCCGINRHNIKRYNNFVSNVSYVAAFATRTFPIVTDFQSIGSRYNMNDPFEKSFVPLTIDRKPFRGSTDDSTKGTLNYLSHGKISYRDYLEDADFVVTISCSDSYAIDLIEHIKHPVWIPYFGRATCLPDCNIYIDSFISFDKALANTKKILNKNELIAYFSNTTYLKNSKYTSYSIYDYPLQTRLKYRNRMVYKVINYT